MKNTILGLVRWRPGQPTQEPFSQLTPPEATADAIWEVLIHPKLTAVAVTLTPDYVDRNGLRPGDEVYLERSGDGKWKITGRPQRPIEGNRRPRVIRGPEEEDLEQIPASDWIPMHQSGRVDGIMLDLIGPIGRGSRVAYHAPPKVGKTTILKICNHSVQAWRRSVTRPVVTAYIGVDERPEEVHFPADRIFSAPFTTNPEQTCFIIELATAWSIRQAESGVDVVLFIDSLSRAAAVFNEVVVEKGGSLSGGMSKEALRQVIQLFGRVGAWSDPEMGTVTAFATVLRETGNKLLDIFAEEAMGRVNVDLFGTRGLAAGSHWPALLVQEPDDPRARIAGRWSGSRQAGAIWGKVLGVTVEEMEDRIAIFREWLGMEPVAAHKKLKSLAQGVLLDHGGDPKVVWQAIDRGNKDASFIALEAMRRTTNGTLHPEARAALRDAVNAGLTTLAQMDPDLAASVLRGRMRHFASLGPNAARIIADLCDETALFAREQLANAKKPPDPVPGRKPPPS